MSLTPDVLWAQRPDSVYLTIDLKDVQEIKVTLERESLTFSGRVGTSLYEFSLEFHAPIKREESKWSTRRLVEFCLMKEASESWPRLSKSKLPWVKVDWAKWQDSDDEGEGKGGFDMDGMGGMNMADMMGGMGDPEDEDSDDEEDLPDLEPTEDPDEGGAPAAAAGSKELHAVD
mmetsp:Transcript_121924/g.341305  ORF Transcript_121924/g.341305 Transcript_121924/m.341305 type:complete len:174 (-) Transcript_121924:41-562(-)|eukprot:CAMPEP_0176241440 /NCGR_PEP_ID=MMETSP0121_2-20121125/29893_1 /TAXON_ID=160619 /ORGANISM="Kryptoperidinium foliaceum, Strain CCMP 1326" /LENGTH=173 /DNA_ID=CAMNT_0017580969 /DNA_START=71 /DNA_END=592 /DNA_ORIENTATION=-